MEIQPDFILVGMQASGAQQVIEALCEPLERVGAVLPAYAAATWAREQAHPTGLPTKPFAIAIPHADAEGVLRSAMAVGMMASPVPFASMEDPDELLPVEIVMLLATSKPEEQIQALRNLATIFGDSEKLSELVHLTEPAAIAAWLEREIAAVPE